MLRKNKGSILIVSIIVFTIISIICITCSQLILSSNRIYNLDYKNEQIKEGNLGAIEIIYSNILKEVKQAISETKSEDEFYSYFVKNNSLTFINKIKNTSNTNLNNITIQVGYNNELSNKEFIHYKISTKYKLEKYSKYMIVSVKIINPLFGKNAEDITLDKLELNGPLDEEGKIEKSNSMIESDEVYIKNEQDNKSLNESDLVILYNYEEI